MRSYFSGLLIVPVAVASVVALAAPTKKTASSQELSPAPTTGLGPAEGDFINEDDKGMISEIEAAPIQGDSFAPKASPNPKTAIEKLPAAKTAAAPKAPPPTNTTGETSKSGASAADALPLEAPVETVPDETTGAAPTPRPEAPTGEEPLSTEALSADAVKSDEEKAAESADKIAEEPAEEESQHEERMTSLSRRRMKRGYVPAYYRDRPTAAFKMQGSTQALGDGITYNGVDYDVRGFGFGLDWLPKFIQPIGVVGFGASFNLYPILPLGGPTRGGFNVFSFGGSVTYQAQYWDGQPIVPFIGYEWQQFKYKFYQGAAVDSGWTLASGMTAGVHFLLNWIEPDAAYEAFKNTGIRRSYLTAEWKQLRTDYNPLDSVDHALYFGLRVEY